MSAGAQPTRLYHFTTAKFALDDLRNSHLKIAQVLDLNDPFELRCMDTSGALNRIAYDSWRTESGDQWGILCFSERWNDVLQWSHYADRHRGVCLGFDVTGATGKFGKVEYVSQKVQTPQKPDQDYMWRCLSTKFSCWEYEREWRTFVTLEEGVWNEYADRKLYFANFGGELRIRHVILGALNETPTREIFDLVASDVRVSRIHLADASFDLTLTDCVRL
jgi:hypothetical protein